MNKLLFALLVASALPGAARAQVQLTSQAFVEKTIEVGGATKVERTEPKVVVPGDKLVFELTYKNAGDKPAANFVLTNPVPEAVAFGEAPGATVSVDGGKSWGALAALKVKQADGTFRPAQAGDVTHVRWAMAQAIPAGAAGKVSFRGTVK